MGQGPTFTTEATSQAHLGTITGLKVTEPVQIAPPSSNLHEDMAKLGTEDIESYSGVEFPEEGAVMEPPQVFRSPEEVQGHMDGLEDALEYDTSMGGDEEGDPIAMELLGEHEPSVDEVVVGSEELPEGGPSTSDLFGEAPAPEKSNGVRRDMTPGHTKRGEAIRARIRARKPPNAHQAKLDDMRARAAKHPMRSGPGADDAGNPLVAPKPKPTIPQAPAHVPGQPTVRHIAPTAPPVEDEDGFPSA